MKILILGSTGFIGNNLLTRLLKEDLVTATAERSSGTDLRLYEEVYDLINKKRPDVIFNLASHGGSVHYVKKNSGVVFYDNVQMALNLYRAVSEINTNIKIIQPFSNCS